MTNNTYVRLDAIIDSICSLERKCDIKQWNGAGYMKDILQDAKGRIKSLPTINPIQEIDTMIEERHKVYIYWCVNRVTKTLSEYEKNRNDIDILQELKQRLTK